MSPDFGVGGVGLITPVASCLLFCSSFFANLVASDVAQGNFCFLEVGGDVTVNVGFSGGIDIGASSSTFQKRGSKAAVLGKVFGRVALDLGVGEGVKGLDQSGLGLS